jgi:catechol 2,3-dioxygenase-like lactoylglutathione lyase family enzyme
MVKFALLSLALIALPLFAQLPSPNAAGVTNGHLHLRVRDVQAQKQFWSDMLGASAGTLGKMEMMKLPGTIVLIQPGEPSGGTKGSIVDHVAVGVRNLKGILSRLNSAGIAYQEVNPQAVFVNAPDGVVVELIEETSLSGAAVNHHIHFFGPTVSEMQAWYVKVFGARPGMRGRFAAADLPGVNLTFSQAEGSVAGSKGRSLDHIGFEIENLEAFCKKLEAQGVKFDVPYRKVPSLNIALAFLTDPWGTYIELTEGLDKL